MVNIQIPERLAPSSGRLVMPLNERFAKTKTCGQLWPKHLTNNKMLHRRETAVGQSGRGGVQSPGRGSVVERMGGPRGETGAKTRLRCPDVLELISVWQEHGCLSRCYSHPWTQMSFPLGPKWHHRSCGIVSNSQFKLVPWQRLGIQIVFWGVVFCGDVGGVKYITCK